METVACHCLKCNAELGRFRNSWNGIGNTYFSPVRPPLSVGGLQSTGDIYEAAQGSQIQDSLLQDLACGACQHVLGLRCDSAPDGHLLQQNQLILRLAEMTVVSEGSGAKAKISIMKTYPLTNSSVRARTRSVSRRASVSRSTPRPKPPRLLPGMPGTPSTISREATPMKTLPQVDVAKFKSWAEAAIKTQQQDIDRISGSVDRIERDMRLLTDFMEELRTEIASTRHLQAERENASVTSVRGELDNLRQQLNSTSRPVSRGSFELSNRSIDIIAKDLQQVGREVDEIDELKAELERLKARLISFENIETNTIEPEMHDSVGETRSRRKRKRKNSQINVGEPGSHLDRLECSPKKRSGNTSIGIENSNAMDSGSVLPGQQVNARLRMVVEISKEAPPSTIPSQDTEVQFNYAQNKVGDEYRAPEPTTPVSAITRSREEREGITHSDETSLPLSERILHLNKVVERDHHMRELDAQRRRKRDSNGLLLRKNGRVDKRSLRFLGDQDSQTPSRWSIAPDLPGTSVAGAQSPDPLELPILPSIEQSQVIFEPGAEPQIRTPTDPRPIKCSSCKKQYTTRAGLRYHLEHAKNAACRQGTGSMAPEQFSCDTYNSKFVDLQTRDKHRCRGDLGINITLEDSERSLAHREQTVTADEATLAERERLVRETLDREMSVVV